MTLQPCVHSPFPDVTGLRTSGPHFSRIGDHCDFIEVQLPTAIHADKLCNHLGVALDPVVFAAWSVVLYHYGSHQASNVEMIQIGSHPQQHRMVLLDFTQPKASADWNLAQLFEFVAKQRVSASHVDVSDTGYASIAAPPTTALTELSNEFSTLKPSHGSHLCLVLTYYVSRNDGFLTLAIKALPSVHTTDSARLQLRQLEALLLSFLDTSQRHPLSLDRFHIALKASDNPNPVDLPPPAYLADRPHIDRLEADFEYFAQTRPDDLALDFRFDLQDRLSVKWTYAEMNACADTLCQLLWSYGVGSGSDQPGDHIVTLYMQKCPETYLSFLAISKAGAAWCPIDTEWPALRRQALLAKSNARMVLTAGDETVQSLILDLQSDQVKSNQINFLRIDQLDANLNVPSQQQQQLQLQPRTSDQLAYMIWTSGTTGLPKGVGIQHSAIVQAMRALRQAIPYGKQSTGTDQVRYLQFSAYVFDLSIMDCFYTWGIGGTICACPRDLLLQNIVAVAHSFKPTHTLLTPVVMASIERNSIPSLQVVINSGEKLTQVVADEWSNNCCLLNLYGPAEATLIAMNRRVPQADKVKSPNIGVALPTVSCHALDKHDNVILRGSVGELVLGGPQLAREYVGDPVKTSQAFFHHPTLGRIYRTGDQVRQLDSGEFEYLGRIDDQVKINGIRIELLEINAAIKTSHGSIKDTETMAFPRADCESELQIVNFSVLPITNPSDQQVLLRTDDDAIKVAQQLRQAATDALPSYMRPAMFLILSRFPKTPSAKIDRVVLKQVLASLDVLDWENKLAGGDDQDDVQDSETLQAETCMRKWLAQLCNVDSQKIGRRVAFPSLGLDSIRAIIFSQKLVQEGYKVSVVSVVQHPTLATLGLHLKSSSSKAEEKQIKAKDLLDKFNTCYLDAVARYLSVPPNRLSAVLPCTPLQQGMLAESQRDPLAYRIQRQYCLHDEVDVERLSDVFKSLVSQCESLRTTFVDVGQLDIDLDSKPWPFQTQFVQTVWMQAMPRIFHIHLTEADDLESVILSKVQNEIQPNPFSSSPPVAFIFAKQKKRTWFIFVAHHSTYDARSLAIMEDWIDNNYRHPEQEPPHLERFSTALNHILPLSQAEQDLRRQTWQNALNDYPKGETTLFPSLSGKRTNKEDQTAAMHNTASRLSSTPWSKIEQVAHQLGLSVRPLVQVAWARVLAAYLDTDHLIIGDSVTGRSVAAELDQVFGPVLSTLPVPITLSASQTAADIASQVDQFHQSVLPAQHCDLGYIRKLLQVSPGQPLFHSVFVLEPAADGPESSSNADGSSAVVIQKWADLGVATEHVLGIEVQPDSHDHVRLGVSWQRSVVGEEFGLLLLNQFDQSLAALCQSPQEGIHAWLSAEDLDRSLISVTPLDLSSDVDTVSLQNVVELVSQAPQHWAQNAIEIFTEIPSNPDKCAPSASITYLELDEASNKVAQLLGGLPKNSIVGICLERSLESYIYCLGVLKAGHAYLPLDETLPMDRKELILLDSSATCLIGSASTLQSLTVSVPVVIYVDSHQHKEQMAQAPCQPGEPRVVHQPDEVAFIIYTSGSTGKPKGCLLTYRNLSAAIESFRLSYEREAPGTFSQPSRYLARSAEAFDVHLLEIFLSLRVGATIVTGPRSVIHEDLGHSMAALQVTHACVVPSLFFSRGQRVKPQDIPTLRALIIGGEALTLEFCKLWGSEDGESPVVLNAYGPSEATIGSSVARVTKDSKPSMIGKPFPGSQYLVLKEVDGQLVATLRGEPGELCIGGCQVGKGYLNRPELKSFLYWKDQWIYRTGDMVRLHPNHQAEYLGRMDGSQVKVRGARLELGEVDAALQACLPSAFGRQGLSVTILSDHPKLQGAPKLVSFVADAFQRVSAGQTIALNAMLIGDKEAMASAVELRKLVRSKIPQYMVPSFILPLSFIPLSTLSGKADSKTLKDLYQSLDPFRLHGSDEAEKRPMNQDEKLVASIVSTVVQPDTKMELGPLTDLITFGLDSLSVVSLAGKLRKAGFNATAASIMNQPTIEAIAKAGGMPLPQASKQSPFDDAVKMLTEKARSLPEYSDVEIEQALPCVPMQVSLIAQAVSESSDSPRYITTVHIDIHGDTDPEQLRNAWQSTLERHQIYRTLFAEIQGQLCQVVLASKSFKVNWQQTLVESVDADELSQQYHVTTAKAIASSFHLEPPLRLKLWLGGQKPRLTLTCSHAIYDGVSLNHLLQQVGSALCNQVVEPTGQFTDAVREIFNLSKKSAKTFWAQNLEGFSFTKVPNLTGMRPNFLPGKDEEITVRSVHSFSVLEATARSRKITLHSLLVSAYCRLLAEYVAEDDVTIGLVLGGRTLPVDGIEAIHGPCVTTVPLRLKELRTLDSEALSVSAHRAINDVLPYQHASLSQIMQWLNLERSPFEALFSYVGVQPDRTGSKLSEAGTIMERDYPLAVEVGVAGDTVQLHVAFNSQRIPREHAVLLANQLDSIIGSISEATSSKPPTNHLSVINKGCYVPSSASETFLARFASHVQKDPHAAAIVFATSLEQEPVTMTYGELDTLSTNMARSLVHHASSIIGVHLTKDSSALYAAILAVWKAGKTYLPLDPTLPKERLEYMLNTVGNAPAITSQATAKSLSASQSQCLDIDTLIKPSDKCIQLPGPLLDTPCYLLFTSGSTGKPKAVQISQRALAGALYSWERMLPYKRNSRFLQLASIGFDVSLIELCMPLSLGFSVGTAPKQVLLEDLTKAINHLGITIADLPAALAGTVDPEDVHLEWLMSGGDAIDERVINQWTSAGRYLVNAWGPTETTIGSTLGRVKRGHSRSVIGEAYPACSMFVLKQDSAELALRGAIGELAVGGPQLADKYYGREDLTNEKFIHLADGNRVYRTGDLGRFLSDDTIECLGRIGTDRQVKVNGQRVELDEISQVLASQKGVEDADVQYLKHPGFATKQLIAFVAQSNEQTARKANSLGMRHDSEAVQLSARLEEEVARRLPLYMIPAHWIVIEGSLPLTHNNKTDHKALSTLFEQLEPNQLSDFGSLRDHAISNSSWTEDEEKLQRLVSKFCSIPPDDIKRTTSFHRLGIDSISAIKLVKVLKKSGYALTVADVLSSPFISALAEKQRSFATANVQRDSKEVVQECTQRVVALTDTDGWKLSENDLLVGIVPCTPLQAGMITQTLASEGKRYFHHHAFRTTKSVETVVAVWNMLVQRLDILRCTFHATEGGHDPWVMAIHSMVTPAVVMHQERFSPNVEMHKIQGQPDLSSDAAFGRPPHVLHVWNEDESTCVFQLSIHHSLYDATSLLALFAELDHALAGEGPAHSVEWAPFLYLAPHLQPSTQDVDFWAQQLHGLTPALLLKQKPTSPGKAVEVQHDVRVPLETLESGCRRVGVSLQVAATLAYTKLLAIETGSRDVCFGQIFSLRDALIDAESSIGPALNTVATRIRFDDLNRSATQQLEAMQKVNDQGRPHRKAALGQVQKQLSQLGIEPPLFDALFDFQKTSSEDDGIKAYKVLHPVELKGEETSPQYTLNVEFVQHENKLSLVATADSNVYDQQGLNDLLVRLEGIVLHLFSNLDSPVSELPDPSVAFPKTLPSMPFLELSAVVANGPAPLSEDGIKLAEIVAEVSGARVDQIHASTKLSSLGLDSISAIRIASAARKKGLRLGIADIISGETVEGILHRAGLAKTRKNTAKATVPASVQRVAEMTLQVDDSQVERILPVLSGQSIHLATWYLSGERHGVFSFCYRMSDSDRIEGKKLDQAWKQLQARHPILRTCFVSVDREAYQVVLKAGTSESSVQIWETLEDMEPVAEQVIRKVGSQNWDLKRPPIQLTHVSSETEDMIVLTLHHALYDAFAIDLFVQDLACFYFDSEPESSSQWIEFVDYISTSYPSNQLSTQTYWKRYLETAQPALLPIRHPENHSNSDSFRFFPSKLKGYRTYEAGLRERGTNFPSLLQAGWSRLLARMTSTQSPLFGVFQLGRSSSFDNVDVLAGPCLSLLPICLAQSHSADLFHLAHLVFKNQPIHSSYDQSLLSHLFPNLTTPLFNSFINILLPSSSSSAKTWTPIQSTTTPTLLPNSKPQLESDLMISPLLNTPSLYIDFQLDSLSNSIDIGIRFSPVLFTNDELSSLVDQFVDQILECLA